MDKHLHIICLNVPYPVNYGGVFDLYYKLEALQKAGVRIYLHCFEYGRGEQPALDQFCETVWYYERNSGRSTLTSLHPYIVSSRKNDRLLANLLADNHPILMEGVHCTYLLTDKRFKHRKCFVRLHNVEHLYYRNLYLNAAPGPRKLYYFFESLLLKRYEKRIARQAVFWNVNENDSKQYRKLGCTNITYLPLFLPPWSCCGVAGKGSFCLYQGDLSTPENERAVLWLAREVFSTLNLPFVIAGKNPGRRLTRALESNNMICLIENPDEKEMQDLIQKSHIIIAPSFNATGIKLKLLNALFNGRFCVTNEAAVAGTGLSEACIIANTAADFIAAIQVAYTQEFTTADLEKRQAIMSGMFNNQQNANKMVGKIWNE